MSFNIGNIFESVEHVLIGSLGTDIIIPEAVKDLVQETESLSHDEIARLATIPEATLQKLAAPGADMQKVIVIRDNFALNVADGIEELVAVLRSPVPTSDPATAAI